MQIRFIFTIYSLVCLLSCTEKKTQEMTPWGEPLNGEQTSETGKFTLSDIQANGEMIMLTTSGPDTYFDYHGHGMGTQFLLCERFAQHIGVSLRVEVCKTKEELVKRLRAGDGDIIACQMPKDTKGLTPCGYAVDSLGTSWLAGPGASELADSLNSWYKPELIASIKREEQMRYTTQSVRRHTYAPMLNAKEGRISQYDHLFQRYAPLARWDWRLLAAQCYQESCFDPKAVSWAGACGLMQIMPSTATELGLPASKVYDPEENIYAATRYIAKLNNRFQDVRDPRERQLFILGSYNGGSFHIRDAMALTRKYGGNPYRWDEVAEYVVRLSSPQYYNDPIVKNGYMRGQETANYVSRIRERWAQYRGVARGGSAGFMPGFTPGGDIPHEAKRRHRFKL